MNKILAKTVKGIGSNGKEYIINGYKSIRIQNGEEVESKLVEYCETDDGIEVRCKTEKPLVFWIPNQWCPVKDG